ncbi:MAG: hypothetical protein K2W85_12730 [Phycisphaerales bacterium]|nr:hypothetical protein [Phycisphaerales bacterium]
MRHTNRFSKAFRGTALLVALSGAGSLFWTSQSFAVTIDASATLSFQPAEASQPVPAAASGSTVNPNAKFALSSERIHGDPEIGWKGFLSGLRGFEHFYDPIGQPLYFESPFVNSSLRLLYLHHEFANGSQLQGGHVDVVAAQARIAITERIAIIATKDGYSWLRPGIFNDASEGWNDIALGAKWAFYVDRESDFVATTGARWMLGNGNEQVLMGRSQEISPFISVAKGFDKLHLLGNLTLRLPTDSNKGNRIFQWDLHASYDILPEVLPGLAPVIELHGLHYLSDADRLPFSVGGLDYSNFGSSDVAGSTVIWAGAGARWKLTPNLSVGSTYEFALTNRNADIMDDRVTVDITLTW